MEAIAMPATCASERCMECEDDEPPVGEDSIGADVAVEELDGVAIVDAGVLLVGALPAVDVGGTAVTTTVLCVGITASTWPEHIV